MSQGQSKPWPTQPFSIKKLYSDFVLGYGLILQVVVLPPNVLGVLPLLNLTNAEDDDGGDNCEHKEDTKDDANRDATAHISQHHHFARTAQCH
jgi:hypothetical protein